MNKIAAAPSLPADETVQMETIARIINRETGIVLSTAKAGLIRSRLARRLHATRSRTLADYITLVESHAGKAELPELISALTTNVTSFFREAHHFDMLAEKVLPLVETEHRVVRIWSAGCSSGQEPYSAAMTALKRLGSNATRTVRILGTDIDRSILEKGRTARYTAAEVGSIADGAMRPYLQKDGDGYRLSSQVTELVTFRELNLHAAWTYRDEFDAIFCRNVMIYFDATAQNALWRRFITALRPGGWLFIGHSERIPAELRHSLSSEGSTAYRRNS